MDSLEHEARTFTQYLVGRNASPQAIKLYAVAVSDSKPSQADAKLIRFMVRHPHCIGFIDAGLVFTNPTSEARRRLYVIFAILEASKEYCDSFMPIKRSPLYILSIFYACIRAAAKAGVGVCLVKVIA